MIDPGYKILMVNPIIIASVELLLLYLFIFYLVSYILDKETVLWFEEVYFDIKNEN